MSPEDEEKLKARIWWAMPGNKYTNDPTIEQITEALLRLLQQHQTERRGQSKALVRKSHEIRQLKKQIEYLVRETNDKTVEILNLTQNDRHVYEQNQILQRECSALRNWHAELVDELNQLRAERDELRERLEGK